MKDIDVITISKKYYTVIGVKIGRYQSIVAIEKHFSFIDQARNYADTLKKDGLFTVIAEI